jgi:hypothetical protein
MYTHSVPDIQQVLDKNSLLDAGAAVDPPLTPRATAVVLAGATLITLFRNQFAKTKEERRLSLEALSELVKTTRAKNKSRLPWLKLAQFGDKLSENGCLRTNANMLVITGVEGDHDNGGMSFDEAYQRARQARVKILIYTTASHTEARQRWRALAVFSEELTPDQRGKMMNRLAGIFGDGVFAGESWVLSQAYHFGAVGDNPHPRVEVIDGDYIDLRDDLDAAAVGKPGKASASAATTSPVNLTGAKLAAPAPTTSPVIDLTGVKPALAQIRWSSLNASAISGVVDLDGIRTAAEHIPPMDRPAWWDNWVCPIAAAIVTAPQYEGELREIFDETNQRTADQDKVDTWEGKNTGKDYFDSALKTLDDAIARHRPRVAANEKTIHFTRIFQVALDNGWKPAAHIQVANGNAAGGGRRTTTVVACSDQAARSNRVTLPSDQKSRMIFG